MKYRLQPILIFTFLLSLVYRTSAQNPESLSLDSLLNIQISSASRYEQKTSEAPGSITILTSEDIKNFGWDNLTEALNAVRSIYSTFDRNYEYIGMRGFSRPTDYNNRLQLMVDGHLLNENIWGSAPMGIEMAGWNLDMVERIEIIRGPSSSLYGNYGMQGIINIVFKKGKEINGLQLSAEGGSFGKWQGSVAAGKRFNNGLDIAVGFRGATIAGQTLEIPVQADSGIITHVVEKFDWRKSGGYYFNAAWKGFRLQSTLTTRDMGVPTAAFETVPGDPRFRVVDKHFFTELGWKKEIGANKEISARMFADNYYYRGEYPYDTSEGGLYTELGNSWWSGIDARFRWDLLPTNRLIAGGEFQYHFAAHYQNEYELSGVNVDELFSYYTASVYLQDEWQITKKISVVAGARFDQTFRKRKAVTPKFAMVYHPLDNTTIKLLIGQAFRAPSYYELELFDPTYSFGNPNLMPERFTSFELVAEQRLGKNLYITLSAFRNHFSNLVDPLISPTDSLITFENLGSATAAGVEAEGTVKMKTGFSLYSSLNLQFAQDDSTKERLTNSPVFLAKAGFSLPVVKRLRFSADALYESARASVFGTHTDPYVVINSQLMAKLPAGFSVYFKVRNVLNQAYSLPGGAEHTPLNILQNGRTFNLKIQYQF